MSADESKPTMIDRRKTLLIFLPIVLCSTSLVMLIGWMTSVRPMIYGVVLSWFALAFLPFVIIAIGIVLPFLMLLAFIASIFIGLLTILMGGGAIVAAEVPLIGYSFELIPLGVVFVKPFYSWLFRIKHPIIWGIVVGALLGAVGLGILLMTVILPGERRTTEILMVAQNAVHDFHKKHGKLPDGKDGFLRLDEGGKSEAVVDGFGRPLLYSHATAQFQLKSIGFDGKVGGGDDFCVHDQVKLTKWQMADGGSCLGYRKRHLQKQQSFFQKRETRYRLQLRPKRCCRIDS